jgi:ACT domain-containing protein
LRDFSLPSNEAKKHGPYKLPERMQTMQKIYSLIIEGYPYNKIMQQLQISERTFYRYLEAIFANDRRLLAENVTDEEFLNQMVICRDRLLQQRRDVLKIQRLATVLELMHIILQQKSQQLSGEYMNLDQDFYLKGINSQGLH